MKYRLIALSVAAMISGAALAQTTAVPAAPDPAVGGQATTKTPAGVANPTQRPDGSKPASREMVKSEARSAHKNTATTDLPKGEATTTMNNQPNPAQPTGAMTRAEIKPTSSELKPQMGKVGERPDVPTNPTEKTGTPK
ncbi:serine/threonine protein kinase [Variovorax sp. GT1P44]|uniref:serine/threonine protein kinase n=1 Tax=Variovorax sp. GT1P44 TaxID=3443742 RepID=UPI003F48DD19